MRTLIYKRTHNGDPDESGQFGIRDCMGQVRRWNFDAVIGVGGVGPEARSYGIDEKVNWIGIGPHKEIVPGRRGPIVTFDHFMLYGDDAPTFEEVAPLLAHRIYSKNVRVIMNGLSPAEEREVEAVLKRAKNAPPSPCRTEGSGPPRNPCAPRRQPIKRSSSKDCSR
jgi:hypothetical protein